jgi:hydrogenase large subunit
MPSTIKIDPVTRLEGHLKIEVTVDGVAGAQKVVDAKATGTLFRGFEAILKNRNPLDAPDITQRICGVCPVSHGLAASMTLENAAGVTAPDNARIMRNLVLGSNFVQSHILHFYHLAVQDFVSGPDMPPWQPNWAADKRFDAATSGVLVSHYVQALEMRRKAHEMGALFGGRLPHPPAFVPGGFTTTPRPERITKFRAYLAELIAFINNVYLPDVAALANAYADYYSIGRGHGNLLAYGVFDLDGAGQSKLLRRGRILGGTGSALAVDPKAITESVTYSWYSDTTDNLSPSSGVTQPVYPKGGAYSWLKAPRYGGTSRRKGKRITVTPGAPYETGPLARMWVNGEYTRGISVMDRHASRAQETLKVAHAMDVWATQLGSGPVYQQYVTPTSASGFGLTEAPRGALGHWVDISNGKIGNYQVLTPTCWNASPRDSAGVPGPIEQALVGTPVANLDEPVEVLRVVHSFDPCLSCAVHVMRPAEGSKIFALGHYHGEDEVHEHTHSH